MHHGRAKQCNGTLALALEPSILVNSTGMSCQCVCSSLKSLISMIKSLCDVAAKVTLVVARYRCRVMLVTALSSHAGDGAAEVTWPWCDVTAESCW
jgi:hypothetical protein